MPELPLDTARKILDAALAKGIEKKLKPLFSMPVVASKSPRRRTEPV